MLFDELAVRVESETGVAQWSLDALEISGGFLADLSLHLPQGLVCIIGPRGSGKSTLAEALRLALNGTPTGAGKARLDFLKANLGGAVVTVRTSPGTERGSYTIRRSYGQPAILTSDDGRPVTDIDLDRGTFLPIDAYSSLEIEAIADESLGARRRSLLDDLCSDEMQRIQLELGEHRRTLEANADAIRAVKRRLADLTEQIEEYGDARGKLEAIPSSAVHESTPEFAAAAQQCSLNEREASAIRDTTDALSDFETDFVTAIARAKSRIPALVVVSDSANAERMNHVDAALTRLWSAIEPCVAELKRAVSAALGDIHQADEQLRVAHAGQTDRYLVLQQQNRVLAQAMEARSAAERAVAALETLTNQREHARAELRELQQQRKQLKGKYLLARDRISEQREVVAERLLQQAGRKVRVRVQRNADTLEYQGILLEALRGSRLRNQDDILQTLTRIRPEQLAQIAAENDLDELEAHTSFGRERGRKILDAFRENIDLLALDVLSIDDQVCVELNVASSGEPEFKDAAELSRGQKCTALLPILLARRETPLLIDQPEDNLDNHFIYETVVETILRLKARRQMLFITHNANIPVLGEADLVVVMASDGRHGYVEKAGTVEECRTEIIDLLEGGEEAFELRRQRYGNRRVTG